MKYSVITFGCRVNQADSLALEEELMMAGGEAVPADRADLILVNTCSVTATADQGARQIIRRVARENPRARIVVTGCYATRSRDEVAALPSVVQVVANADKPRLLALARDFVSTAERFGAGDGPCGTAIEPGVGGRTAFTLRVQTGCGEPCSYCIIPSTRGEPRSVPTRELARDIERIAAAGYKEIALTGVHLGSYGRDLTPATSLAQLLAVVDNVASRNDIRIRISSLEPMDCTGDIVDRVAGSGTFAPHLHLPLQHASPGMLAAMRRPYTIEYYASLVDRIREHLPNASIGTDVIVGFPGESERDVEALEQYLDRSPVTHVHVFPYSDRAGTAASTFGGKVHGGAIRERARRIRAVGQRRTRSFLASQIDTIHRALTIEDGTQVVTGNYLKLRIPPGSRRNEWVTVRVRDAEIGELVNSPTH